MTGSESRASRRLGLAALGALALVGLAVAVFVPGASARSLHGSLTVTKSGTGSGTVVGRAAAQTVINCGTNCAASVRDHRS